MLAQIELEKALLRQGLSYCYRLEKKSSEHASNEKVIHLQPFYPYDGCNKLTILTDLGNFTKSS